MRRWAWVVVLALFAAGCGGPAGTDGSLVDDWSAQVEPKIFVPAAEVCHPTSSEDSTAYLVTYNPVDCGQSHSSETVHIGQFTGASAGTSKPPGMSSPTARAAFNECDAKATEYVGAQWRSGRLYLGIMLPSNAAWAGGARWFRCDMSETPDLESDNVVRRTASLRGALKAGSPLAYGCYQPVMKGDDIDVMKPVGCGQAHRAEFVGVWTAPETPFADFVKNDDRAHRGCLGVVASYAKVPNDGNMKYRAGTIYYYPNQFEWGLGDRGVKCFFWGDRDIKKSVKAAGSAGLPIR
ncbi:septum formation family protein [Micromonospora sp. CPCC 206061]|uniref:septum formation family protein n=1 Tax=Micromonospora sp. CPCC 206061 TaxID=3122410 RepID=UPI002FEF4CD4